MSAIILVLHAKQPATTPHVFFTTHVNKLHMEALLSKIKLLYKVASQRQYLLNTNLMFVFIYTSDLLSFK